MARVCLRFYEELNGYLAPERRKAAFTYYFQGGTVQEMLDELGVPCAEVDLILVNGESVGLSYPVQDGDRISVYPAFEAFDITPVLRVRARPLRRQRFVVLEPGLRRLACCLRALGFDVSLAEEPRALNRSGETDDAPRILLGRAACSDGRSHYVQVRATRSVRQLAEVLDRLDLHGMLKPLGRCPRCNTVLRSAAAVGRERQNAGMRTVACPGCHKEYRFGRYERWMRMLLRRVG